MTCVLNTANKYIMYTSAGAPKRLVKKLKIGLPRSPHHLHLSSYNLKWLNSKLTASQREFAEQARKKVDQLKAVIGQTSMPYN